MQTKGTEIAGLGKRNIPTLFPAAARVCSHERPAAADTDAPWVSSPCRGTGFRLIPRSQLFPECRHLCVSFRRLQGIRELTPTSHREQMATIRADLGEHVEMHFVDQVRLLAHRLDCSTVDARINSL